MLLEAILKHSQRAGLVEEANALEQVRFKTKTKTKTKTDRIVEANTLEQVTCNIFSIRI